MKPKTIYLSILMCALSVSLVAEEKNNKNLLDRAVIQNVVGTTYEMVSFNPNKKGRVFITILPDGNATRWEEFSKSHVTAFSWRGVAKKDFEMQPLGDSNTWRCTVRRDGKELKVYSDFHKKTLSARSIK